MTRNLNYAFALALTAGIAGLTATPASADEGSTSVVASAADYDSGPQVYLRGDVGLGFGGKASLTDTNVDIEESDPVTSDFNANDATFMQAGIGVDFGKLAIDATVSRESGEFNLGVPIDATVVSVMLNGEVDVYGDDDKGVYVRGGYGLSEAELGFAPATVETDNGDVWALGGGYRFVIGGVDADIGYEYRSSGFEYEYTDHCDNDHVIDAEFDRHVVRFGLRFG